MSTTVNVSISVKTTQVVDDDCDNVECDNESNEQLSIPKDDYNTFCKWIELLCQSGWYQSIGSGW